MKIREIHYFSPVIVKTNFSHGYFFKCAISLHKHAIIPLKIGKICECLLGNNQREKNAKMEGKIKIKKIKS